MKRPPAILITKDDFDKDFLAKMRNTKAGERVTTSGNTLDLDPNLLADIQAYAQSDDETEYLLSSEANARRLRESIKQMRQGAVRPAHEVFDPEFIAEFANTPYDPEA